MTKFPGTVSLEDDRVQVTVGLDADRVTLVSGDVAIGDWPAEECSFVERGDGSWLIEAEDDAVYFLPDDPGLFASGLATHRAPHSERPPVGADSEPFVIVDGPPPRTATLVGFFALCLATAGLGVWSLLSLL